MLLTIRPATLRDAEWIGTRLRAEDAREVETATGMASHEVVPLSFVHSDACYTIRLNRDGRVDEHPAVIFGVATDPTDVCRGVMWLLATDEITRAPLSILKEAGHWLEAWCRAYPHGIHNVVDARNDLHVRWLRLLGFHFGTTVEFAGAPFIHVHRSWTDV